MSNHEIEGAHDENLHDDPQATAPLEKGHQHEQKMDQAIDKSPAQKGGMSELGVKWTGGHYSGKKLRCWFFLCCLLTIGFGAIGVWWMFSGRMGNHAVTCWIVTAILPLAAWCYYVTAYYYRTWTIKYRLTTHRLYNEYGLLKRTVDTLEIIDIEDMKMEQSFVDRFINGGVGTVVIISNDKTHPTLRLDGLENPQDAFESIDEMRRRRRSDGVRTIRSVNA